MCSSPFPSLHVSLPPFLQLGTWFATIDPTTQTSRVCRIVTRAVDTHKSLSVEKQSAFLCQSIDLSAISDSLTLLGINRQNALQPPTCDTTKIYNSTVMDFHKFLSCENASQSILWTWLASQYNVQDIKTVKKVVDKIVAQHRSLQVKKHRNPQDFQDFLLKPFTITYDAVPLTHSASTLQAGCQGHRPAVLSGHTPLDQPFLGPLFSFCSFRSRL